MDELIELVVDVLRIADEFLMDRLKEICESVLGEQGNLFFLLFFFVCVYFFPSFVQLKQWRQQ